MATTMKPRHLQPVPDLATDRVTLTVVNTTPAADWATPLSGDEEDARLAATSPEAAERINDQADRAIERLGLGDSILAIIADAFRAGAVHGYQARVHDERVSREVEGIVLALQPRGGDDSA